jgi:hypothetical protein
MERCFTAKRVIETATVKQLNPSQKPQRTNGFGAQGVKRESESKKFIARADV